MEVSMGNEMEGEIIFDFRSDKQGLSAEVVVYKSVEGKREKITTVTLEDIRDLGMVIPHTLYIFTRETPKKVPPMTFKEDR